MVGYLSVIILGGCLFVFCLCLLCWNSLFVVVSFSIFFFFFCFSLFLLLLLILLFSFSLFFFAFLLLFFFFCFFFFFFFLLDSFFVFSLTLFSRWYCEKSQCPRKSQRLFTKSSLLVMVVLVRIYDYVCCVVSL